MLSVSRLRMHPGQKVPASVPVHYSDLSMDALEIDVSLEVGWYAVERERADNGWMNDNNASSGTGPVIDLREKLFSSAAALYQRVYLRPYSLSMKPLLLS